jgi:hypothetical protein
MSSRTHLIALTLAAQVAALVSISLPVARAQAPAATKGEAGRMLSNGIRLPEPWPPRLVQLPHDPVTPPYLKQPPAVIPVNVGRQLFVDDFLIEHTTLTRTFHTATYFEHNPVLKPDQPWETATQPNPTAMVFSDGVWFDPADRLFKMWYMAGYVAGTAYATSKDGIHWDKPKLDVFPGTNLVQKGNRDSSTVWLDPHGKDPGARFKMGWYSGGVLHLTVSPDGVHWRDPITSGPTGDRTTFFYNPFMERWVFSLRTGLGGFGRARRYWEAKDFLADAHWAAGEATPWQAADNADPERDDLKTPPQLYNLDCVAYESLMLGLFTIWRGQPKDRAKPNEICLGFSRDGFHFSRPDRRAFIPVSEHQGDWNWGNVQSAGGGCLIVGDKLYFYVSGRGGVPGATQSGVCSVGLATLRRDGFASMDAPGSTAPGGAGPDEGTLTTRPIRFDGHHLFVNADTPDGELRVEVLDEASQPIAPFTRDACFPVKDDSTHAAVHWRGGDDLSKLAGRTVRLRFHLRRGRLYTFWVSPDATDASRGYVAGGGPAFDGPIDNVGRPIK